MADIKLYFSISTIPGMLNIEKYIFYVQPYLMVEHSKVLLYINHDMSTYKNQNLISTMRYLNIEK